MEFNLYYIMKKLLVLLLALGIIIACSKDDEESVEPISNVEYRISTSVDGPMVKYIDKNGDEGIDFLNDSTEWVYTFQYTTPLDSIGFKIKDFITWVEYKVIINSDTVINYVGPVPEGGYAHWYGVYYYVENWQ